ncbi:hypothetical protein KQX54_019710 [Cotesia glomerata]|uniref:Uncharacterized protein n=1 Tax=Cotesia glomerata TaxID=32391 RepID=A0AAV7IH11_COTGL|nr:hypothetical protein KQX54_019710 [Cotesia glomerata]
MPDPFYPMLYVCWPAHLRRNDVQFNRDDSYPKRAALPERLSKLEPENPEDSAILNKGRQADENWIGWTSPKGNRSMVCAPLEQCGSRIS